MIPSNNCIPSIHENLVVFPRPFASSVRVGPARLGSDYRSVGHIFGVSRSTVCITVNKVCKLIVTHMLARYIQIPSGASLKEVMAGFEDLGFPHCAGAVDGTHIPIISPRECPADYYNRKGWHSIIMQGLVDHHGHFTNINIGWPGRVHDARVFCNSSLYQKGAQGTLFPNWSKVLCGTNVPVVILGDPAYPLLTWLMKAYQDNGNLSSDQKNFSYRLSHAHVVVEHAYGRLKGR